MQMLDKEFLCSYIIHVHSKTVGKDPNEKLFFDLISSSFN